MSPNWLRLSNRYISSSWLIATSVLIVSALLAVRAHNLLQTPQAGAELSEQTTANHTRDYRRLELNELLGLHLFGQAELAGSSIPTSAQQDIPETHLKFVLQGTFTHTDQEQASALIATDLRGKAKLYRVGQELPGRALLHAVERENVILKRNGRLEKLLFPRAQGDLAGSSVAPSSSKPSLVNERSLPERGNNLKSQLRQLREQLNQSDENLRI